MPVAPERFLLKEYPQVGKIESVCGFADRREGIVVISQFARPEQEPSRDLGSAGHLECTCEGFQYRGECSHVRQGRKTALA